MPVEVKPPQEIVPEVDMLLGLKAPQLREPVVEMLTAPKVPWYIAASTSFSHEAIMTVEPSIKLVVANIISYYEVPAIASPAMAIPAMAVLEPE